MLHIFLRNAYSTLFAAKFDILSPLPRAINDVVDSAREGLLKHALPTYLDTGFAGYNVHAP